MAKFYHVIIERGGLAEILAPEGIEELLNHAIDWIEYYPHCYLLYSEKSANKWHALLRPIVLDDGRLFICELNVTNRGGWMPNKIWRWIERASTLDRFVPGEDVFIWIDHQPIQVHRGTVIAVSPEGRPRVKIMGADLRVLKQHPFRISKLHPVTRSLASVTNERLLE